MVPAFPKNTFVYWTHEELFGYKLDLPTIQEKLAEFSVHDCLAAIGRLSCLLEAQAPWSVETQTRVVKALGLPEEAEGYLVAQLQINGNTRPIFSAQLFAEAVRLSLRHASPSSPTVFDSGKRFGAFCLALLGVTDLLADGVDPEHDSSVRAFALRQHGLGRRNVRLYAFVRHWYLLTDGWREVHGAAAADALAARFEEEAGLPLSVFFSIGAVVHAYFLNYGSGDGHSGGLLAPQEYLKETAFTDSELDAFIAFAASTPTELAGAVAAEDASYGETQYWSAAFEMKPLVRIGSDQLYVPVSFAALERFVTEAPYWLLRNSYRESEGRDEAFTSPFGEAFEQFAVNAVQRITELDVAHPMFFPEIEFKDGRNLKRSSDANVFYPGSTGFLIEIVSGRLRVATTTRGAQHAFESDIARLVSKKAKQLGLRYTDFKLFQKLKFPGVSPAGLSRVFGVVLMLEDLPSMMGLYEYAQRTAMTSAHFPKFEPTLTVMSADDLAAIERLVETTGSFVGVMQRWKTQAGSASFSTWLELSGQHPIGLASWYLDQYKRLAGETVGYLTDADAADDSAD